MSTVKEMRLSIVGAMGTRQRMRIDRGFFILLCNSTVLLVTLLVLIWCFAGQGVVDTAGFTWWAVLSLTSQSS